MLKTIRNIAIVGCLAMPFALASRSSTKGDSAKEVKATRELARKIQKAVAKDQGLQPSSRNIDVTIQNSIVTLKGTVQSDEESQAILGKAESLVNQNTPDELINAPEMTFDNELIVALH
jgi:hypothetical protein